MRVNFLTPTIISYVDLISMGDSEKADDPSKIGKFASGLKYAMALMLRHGVEFTVSTWEEGNCIAKYEVGTYEMSDEIKTKLCIEIADTISDRHWQTGFATYLGLNWEPWMILRELFSNMKDEKGRYETGHVPAPYNGTCMTLDFEDASVFAEVWANKHLYVNETEPLFHVSPKLRAYDNPEKHLRIYKQGILVYEDTEKHSEYGWEIEFGEIDERRLLNNVTGVLVGIADEISATQNEEFLRTLIRTEAWVADDDFLESAVTYSGVSKLCKSIIFEIYEKTGGEVYTYSYLYNAAKDAPDSVMSGRKIKTVSDHVWNYYSPVSINETQENIAAKEDLKTLKDHLESKYRFTLSCEVKQTSLTGSDVIADKFNKCILIGEGFDVENEMHVAKFIVQYTDMTMAGNIIDNLATLYIQSIRK